MDADDLSQLASLGSGSPNERHLKKQRFTQLQEILNKAFDEDKEEFDRSGIPSSSKPVGKRKPNGKFNRLGLAWEIVNTCSERLITHRILILDIHDWL